MPLFRELTNTLTPLYQPTEVINQQAYPTVQSLLQQMRPPSLGTSFMPTGSSGVTAPADIEPLINEAAQTYNLDPGLLSAVIKQESGFKPGVVSHRGAAGYMQLMPETAKDLGVTDRFDPRQNIMGGARYLRQQMDKFGSPQLALAAYNAGPGNVQKYGGVPPFKETQNYVRNIMNMWGYR